jgi:hypothetical protein
LGIAPDETTFARRGFRGGTPEVRLHLERVGQTFLEGYHLALEEAEPEALTRQLDAAVEREWRGFAFEGAAMALALLDHLTPWRRNRWQTFVQGPGSAHVYMVHVGLGWVVARLPWLRRNVERTTARLDRLVRWLVVEGYGFHEGYFHWPQSVTAQAVPPPLSGYKRRVFDQGLGRSLWFVEGADVVNLPATIASFAHERQADLWSGVGLACAYAGGIEEAALKTLWEAAGPFQPQLGQGAAFAAKARQRAGNPAPHTELACAVLCGSSADVAAGLTDAALDNLPADELEPAFEIWRRRIQAHLTLHADPSDTSLRHQRRDRPSLAPQAGVHVSPRAV